MSAVSVLHSLHDEALGEKIADALSRQGHDARRLGEDPLSGDLMLEDGAAIVIWSEATAKLARLHVQAREALERGALIPITISGGSVPTGFEDLQPVDLSGWGGDVNDPRWRFVLEEISLAAQRLRIEDGSVWMTPEAEATPSQPSAEIEPEYEPVSEPAIDEPSVDVAPEETVADTEIVDEVFPDVHATDAAGSQNTIEPDNAFQGPIKIAAHYQVNTDNYWPEAENASKRPVRFTARNVVWGGGFALFALTAAAIVLGPALISKPVTPDALREAPLGPTIALIQPIPIAEEPIEATALTGVAADDAADAAPMAGSDFEVTSYLEPEDVPVGEGADISSASLAEGQIDREAVTDELAVDASETSESGEDQSIDDDPIEALLAEAADPIEELAALPEVATADIPNGNYFRDCASCPEMVALPAGYFQMGSPEGEPSRLATEGPARAIALARPFALATREVTHAEWQACVDEGGCRGYIPYDMGWGRGNRPVTNVSYEDASAYAQWLSRKTGQQYRLPSEAEWEFAARAGGTTAFSFGPGINTNNANYNGNYAYLGEKGAFRAQTTPVASFAPNNFGLYDMHGNAWEWTSDCWSANHAGAPGDGSPVTNPGCTTRVIKGGAWNTGGWRLRAAHRLDKTGGARENDIGFRVARNAP